MIGEPSFSPMLEVSEEFTLENLNPNGYIIMPTTYEVLNQHNKKMFNLIL